ncbi:MULTISPECIES: hypothetical protein [unclassified Exiguobacterium]|uniref:hypothetical protein n=2 Tax=Exiguobacterium TaxID=33986 RepID=UPI001BE946E4|nr:MULTISPECIES: hypothetical protein [unclassified Exiguobacterium]
MSTQKMDYFIKQNGQTIEEGSLTATGTSVFEMTENVVEQLSHQFGLTEVDFDDVSNYWTFDCLFRDIPTVLQFRPVDGFADKFGVDEEVN